MFSVSVSHERVSVGATVQSSGAMFQFLASCLWLLEIGFAQPTGDLAFHLSGFRVSVANETMRARWLET